MRQEYPIFSPVMGLKEDVPSLLLASAFTPDNLNIVMQDGEIHRARRPEKELVNGSLVLVPVTDANPILLFHWYLKSDGTGKLLAFTAAHVYSWNGGTLSWDTEWTCGSACTDWSVVTFNDICIATNNVDKILSWSGSGDFAALGSSSGLEYATGKYLTKAKFITAFENYLILGYTVKDGTTDPSDITWCALGDHTNWLTGDSGSGSISGADAISGFGQLDNFLVIFKTRSIHRMWLTSSDLIFNIAAMNRTVGCEAPHSIVNGNRGELYFFASDFTFRAMGGAGGEMAVISENVADHVRDIPDNYVSAIAGAFYPKLRLVLWAIPAATAASAVNSILLTYREGVWTRHDTVVSAFGVYKRGTGYTIDTIPFASIDGITWPTIDSTEALSGYMPQICGNYSGNVYTLFSSETEAGGGSYTGFAVLATDLAGGQGTSIYKRALRLKTYWRAGLVDGQMATIYAQLDHEGTWRTIGTVQLYDAAVGDSNDVIIMRELPCDLRAKHFLFKIEAANPFMFVGLVTEFIVLGNR
jgi:hypothetical protein